MANHGRFVWHELLTSDPKAAAAFYGKVVGWKPQPWGNDPSYTLLTMGGRPMAGSMVLPEAAKAMGAHPHWESYISTPDVDATAMQAVQLGGRVLKAGTDIPEIGRFAILQDPQLAVFGLFTPKQAPASAPAKPGLGDFFWHELATTHLDAAFSFYQTLFGWTKTGSMDMGANGLYQMFGIGGEPMGGMFTKSPSMPGPAAWLPYAVVPDAKRAAVVVKQLGGTVMHGPAEVPGGDWILQGMDLQGAMFAVHSIKPASAKPKPAAKKSKPAAKPKPAAKKPKPAAKPKPTKKQKKTGKKKATKKVAKKGGKKR